MNGKSAEQEIAKVRQDYHDHHDTDPEVLERTLLKTIEVLEKNELPYALMGGVAVKNLGRPRSTHDIDIFVRQDDALKVLKALEKEGFQTEERDPTWLFKAWRDDVLVDIIFKSEGEIYFDEEAQAHIQTINFQGRHLKAVSPEDFIVIKAAVHDEKSPHWYDALAVLTRSGLNWDYLVHRARHAPRRVLSLLIFAQSNDIRIPQQPIKKLFNFLFDSPEVFSDRSNPKKFDSTYLRGKLREKLATHPKIADQDVDVYVSDEKITIRGLVFTQEQKAEIDKLIRTLVPDRPFENLLLVENYQEPAESESIL